MSETFDIYNLFFLALAVVIFLRLRSVLGRRTGNERKPPDLYGGKDAPQTGPRGANGDDNIIALPKTGAEGDYGADEPQAPNWADFAKAGSPLDKTLKKIFKADSGFDPARFLEGARAAYEMIVVAFAQGDKKTLKPLLNDDVFNGFSSVIDERERENISVQSTFVGIEKADIIDAALTGRKASLTVKFVSELITATFDAGGKLIDGDPKSVREVTDIWTFARDVGSRNPNWKLVATESAQ